MGTHLGEAGTLRSYAGAVKWEWQEVPAKRDWGGVAPSVSMGKSAEVFRPPEKLRLGWGESCWPMTCDPRRGKTKPQAGWEL